MVASIQTSRPRALRILLIWLLVELIAAAQVRTGREILLVSWLRTLASPVEPAATSLVRSTRELAWGFRDFRRLSVENDRLSRQLAETAARVHLLAEELEQYRRSSRLAVSFPSLDASSSIATCIHRSLGDGRLLIDAGSANGAHRNMPVVAGGGLVGRIIRVGHHQSWVETIALAGSAVAVAGGANSTPCMAVGTGGGTLQVEYVPRRAPIARGTLLVTTGVDGVYPPGIPVASVVRVSEGPGAFLRVEAVPTVDLARLRTVLLVGGWNNASSRPGTP